MSLPSATICFVSRSASCFEPSHQTISSGLVSAAISSTHARRAGSVCRRCACPVESEPEVPIENSEIVIVVPFVGSRPAAGAGSYFKDAPDCGIHSAKSHVKNR